MVSASPGMTRIKPNTMSDESTRTGTARRSRRSTYLCMPEPPTRSPPLLASLLVHPGPRQGRRAVPVGQAERRRGNVAHVRMEEEEAVVVRHPQPEHLVVLAVDHLLGQG